jgi:hypothetical protein
MRTCTFFAVAFVSLAGACVALQTELWAPVPALFWDAKPNTKPKESFLTAKQLPGYIQTFLKGKTGKNTVVGFVHDTLSVGELSQITGAYGKPGAATNPFQSLVYENSAATYAVDPAFSPLDLSSSVIAQVEAALKQGGMRVYRLSMNEATDFFQNKGNDIHNSFTWIYVSSSLTENTATLAELDEFYSHVLAAIAQRTKGRYTALLTAQNASPLTSSEQRLSDEYRDGRSTEQVFVEMEEGRRLTEKQEAVAATIYLVPSSSEILTGTVLSIFLVWLLWIAIGCLAAIPSSQRMFTQPPGPKDGDPQYANTAFEGKRFYPFKNLPPKEF